MRGQEIPIKIEIEKNSQQSEVEDEINESSPFPVPLSSQEKDSAKNNPWKLVNESVRNEANNEQVAESARKWIDLSKALKSTPSNIKKFLGIDSNHSAQDCKSTGSNQCPIHLNKTLVNWNERTFCVLKNNMVFGGKLKKTALNDYIQNLDENIVDESDVFLLYKSTGDSTVIPRKTKSPAYHKLIKAFAKDQPGKFPTKEEEEEEEKEDIPTDEADLDLKPSFRAVKPRSYDQVDVKGPVYDNPAVIGYRETDEEENFAGPCDAFTHAFSGQRVPGVGFCGRLFDNDLDDEKKIQYFDILKSVDQHRPYFTYWITFVQIVICFVSLFAYGLAPIGFSFSIQKGMATTINLEKQLISFPVKQNFWIGPAAMDLVHLGAKYAPCMRNDSNVFKVIEQDRLREKDSACCIRNDRGGCVQTNKERCSELMSKWAKWNASDPSTNSKRNSGSVCGLDPDFCSDPDSQKWPDDITQWPICEKPTSVYNASLQTNEHMYCEVIGRPCCIGIQGECVITTLEHCDLMRGYFHHEASLCSQVDCMQDACGMIDFLNPKSPDQVYRLFTSIFIHAGIIQLLISIFFQILILRDVEKLAGCLRVGIIYVASGVIGNLGSAIFLPYQAEVGPMGSQFGIIACLFVEALHAWNLYERPWLVMLKLTSFLVFLLLVGLLPMIDNFANVFGFISGLLLGSILFPNISLNGKCKRVIIIAVCISILVVKVAALIILFYIKPIENCDWCKFLSCPFGKNYCLEMDYNVTRLY